MSDSKKLEIKREQVFFKCRCDASARFLPVYRFNESGEKPGIEIGPKCPATIQCVNCKSMYVWSAGENGEDGGWRIQTPLDDLIWLESLGG